MKAIFPGSDTRPTQVGDTLTYDMTQFEWFDWLGSENLTKIMIEYVT